MNLNNILDTLSKIKKEVKIIDCENPIDIDLKGNSDNPDLVVLNGTITEKDFEDAKSKVSHGGFIAMTRANAKNIDFVERAKELYGESYEIIVKNSIQKELFVTIKNVVIYIKGAVNNEFYNENRGLWYLYKTQATIAQKMEMHNFKAMLSRLEFTEEAPKPKRKRRTKAEIEADKEN